MKSLLVRRSLMIALALLLGLGTLVSYPTVVWRAQAVSMDVPQRQRDTARIAPARLNVRHNPYLKFELTEDSAGTAATESAEVASATFAQPQAMASADFDEDGVPDLIVGGQAGEGGYIAFHRGRENSSASDDNDAAGASSANVPFQATVRQVATSETPNFIAAGDFNADGHQDALTAARGGNSMLVLAGDGQGNLVETQKLTLPGQVTAMTSGEINRADGLADLIVAVTGSNGAQVLVYESPEGAAFAKTEAFNLSASVNSLALAQLDQHYAQDLVVASGRDLLIIKGRDRRLLQQENEQRTVPMAETERVSFAVPILSVTTGDLVWDSDHRTEIAVLTTDNVVHLLQRVPRQGRIGRRRQSEWSELSQTQQVSGRELLAANVSGLPVDELVVVDSANSQLRVLTGEPGRQWIDQTEILLASPAVSQVTTSLTTTGAPVAVLPLHLNNDAISDLVILREHRSAMTLVQAAVASTFVVNSLADTDDGVCNVTNCTLREAINAANANPGADTITFSLGSVVAQPVINLNSGLPTITDPVTLNGNVAGTSGSFRLQLNPPPGTAGLAHGLKITAGNCAISRLVIGGFSGDGIRIETNGGNLITDCRLGTNAAGTAGNPNGGVSDNSNLVLFNSPNNTVGGTTAVARNIIGGSHHGVLIRGAAATGNNIRGNRIGTNTAGDGAVANLVSGVVVKGSPNNIIGGTTAGAGNLIAGNGPTQSPGSGTGAGVFLSEEIGPGTSFSQAAGTLVQGNLLGTNASGAGSFTNGQSGVAMNGASSCMIGGTTVAARNVISGNAGNGVFDLVGSFQTTQNQIVGNFIGVNAAGTGDLGNGVSGIQILGMSGELIGGTVTGARNIISGNGQSGIRISNYEFEPLSAEREDSAQGTSAAALVVIPATENFVQGNFIGTDVNGTTAIANLNGVSILAGANNNTIGGSTTAARNVISGNPGRGVELDNAQSNFVQGNFIGLNANGTAALANGLGIGINGGSQFNQIGSLALITGVAPGNVISGNNNGIKIEQASHNNQFQGNLIGTTANGSTALGNGGIGILIVGASNTLIGGTIAGSRNVISGSSNNGMQISNGGGTLIQGNFIGTDIAGNNAIGNTTGIVVLNPGNVTIGGTVAGAGNVISGNLVKGISLQSSDGSIVQGNKIGTNAAGTGALGNLSSGIEVSGSNNLIGGTSATAANIIAFNAEHGVEVKLTASLNNRINRNSIFSNGGLGINLEGAGANQNDPGDTDAGTNNLQNFPVITVARTSGTVQGTLNSTPNTTFRIEFFVNDGCNSSGHGEGKTFQAAVNITTNAAGNASFNLNLSSLPIFKQLTATATDLNGNTSEFSACRTISLF